VINSNVPNMVGQISSEFGKEGLNIVDMLNRSRGEVAVTLIDVDKPPSDVCLETLHEIEGVLSVRSIDCPSAVS
jgi:D-3-phosphoglycerate dehydrogenase